MKFFTPAHHVSAQVNAEDGDSSQWERNTRNDEEEEGGDLWNITGQCVCNGFLQVVKDETTCSQRRMKHAKGERFTCKNHVYRLLNITFLHIGITI